MIIICGNSIEEIEQNLEMVKMAVASGAPCGVGGATIIGAVIGFIFKKISHTFSDIVLSFAAGAMILVAVHELIPECQKNQKNNAYTSIMGIVAGFTVMMFLDVMLG